MLTSNPLVESWGHFPKSRDRMLSLLRRTNPAGLVILSGDVHHAELASGWKKSSSFSAAPPTASKSSSTAADSTEGGGGAELGVMPPGHEAMVKAGKVEGGGGCPFAKFGGAGPGEPGFVSVGRVDEMELSSLKLLNCCHWFG